MQADEVSRIHQRVEAMQAANADRDRNVWLVRMTRQGRMHELYPQHFADDMPRSMVANTVDNAARDTAELIAPLPSLACASGNMQSAADVRRAGLKNKVGAYYWRASRLKRKNIDFSDATLSYAFGVYIAEADFEKKCPRIRWESSFDSYYYKNRWGDLEWYAKITQIDTFTLCNLYPEKREFIMSGEGGRTRSNNESIRLVTYMDKKQTLVYLPECRHLLLAAAPNPLSRVPVVIAERPDQERVPRGQYDDSVFPLLGKSIMAMMALNAADKAINAPIAMPDDVTEMPFGPDSTIRTQNPQGVQRVRLDIPDDIFVITSQLDQAVKEGSRYPETRTGGVTGNIITGRGVEALAGTLTTQVSTMQTVIGEALEEITSICFEMDATLWPNEQKKITGTLSGKPFELSYIPSRDIGQSYDCTVTYGFASGQTPAQAIVALLQLRADNQISRSTSMRQLPVDMDVEEEQRSIDVEQMSDAAKQGLMGLSQAFGPMVMQGQDPLPVLTAMAKVIDLRRRGKSIDDALIEAFTPPKPDPNELPPEAPPGAPGQPADPGMPPGGPEGELPPGVRENGLMEGVPYGQAGGAPGGMPAVAGLLSRLRGNGSPQMEASVSRKRGIPGG